MQYKVEHNKTVCILPAFTKKVKEGIDSVNEKISDAEVQLNERIHSIYDFLQEIIGEENLKKSLGSDDLDEMDLNDLNVLYLKVAREYDRPVEEFNKPAIDVDTKKMLRELTSAANSITSANAILKK